MSLLIKSFLFLLLFGIFIPGNSFALDHSVQPSGESEFRTEDIVVRGEGEQTSREKPSAFTTILYPEDFLDQFTTVPELLSQQVGLFVKGFGGLGQLSTVSIRGSTAEQVSVFIDGIKINTAEGGAVDFSTIPLGGIERIEIIRGGSSSQFGSDAIGGVINIITKKGQKKRALEFKIGAGSFLTFETQAGVSQRFGKVGLTLNHTHLSSKGNFPFLSTGVQLPGGITVGEGEEFTRIHNSFFSEGFLSRVDTQLGNKTGLTFTNDFFYTSRDEPGPEVETTQLYPANPLEAHKNLFRNSAGLQFYWDDVGVENLRFSFLPNYNVEWSHFTDPSPSLGPPIDVTSLNQAVGAKTKFLYEKVFPKHDHVFTLLYDFRYERFSDSSPLPGAKLSGTQTRVTNAIFFQDEISLLNDKLFLNPSVRWENASDFGNNVALHFGIVGKPTDWISLKSNIENSFRYPSFNELFFPDQGYLRGNPDLEKESAINFDVGATFHHDWFRMEVSYFRNSIDNSIIFVPISAFTIAPVNTGPVTSQGMEVALTLRPVKFMKITGNYTLLDAKFNGSKNQLPGRPQQMANGEVRFDWECGSVFARVQYIDNLPIDFANTKFLRHRALVDVGGTIKIRKNYFFSVEGKNIGNVQTLDSVGFPLPRIGVYASFGFKA